MYLHIGNEVLINKRNIVGIFDIDNTTVSKSTREFFSKQEKEKRVKIVNNDLPRSFLIVKEEGEDVIYLSSLNSSSLKKRWNNSIEEII